MGIGTTSPATKLDVAGEVKLGNTSSTCSSTNEGAQRYNSTSKIMEFCNGTAWTSFTASVPVNPVATILTYAGSSAPPLSICPTCKGERQLARAVERDLLQERLGQQEEVS